MVPCISCYRIQYSSPPSFGVVTKYENSVSHITLLTVRPLELKLVWDACTGHVHCEYVLEARPQSLWYSGVAVTSDTNCDHSHLGFRTMKVGELCNKVCSSLGVITIHQMGQFPAAVGAVIASAFSMHPYLHLIHTLNKHERRWINIQTHLKKYTHIVHASTWFVPNTRGITWRKVCKFHLVLIFMVYFLFCLTSLN